ncbi:MAG: alpha/beta hydrolase [Pygmaiobacter sp.]
MLIHDAVRAGLRAVSYLDLEIGKHYKLLRGVKTLAGKRKIKNPYHSWDHEVVRGGHAIPVRLFSPDSSFSADHVLLFFHGGGWVTGNIDSYDKVCNDMAKFTKQLVVSVDYRLAPEHPFPAGLEDCYCIAKELFCCEGMPGIPPENITLIGDSAGGNLAAAVSLLGRDRGDFVPCRQILLYPATASDHTASSPFPSVRTNGTDYLLTARRVQEYMELYKSSDADFESPYFAPLLATDFSNQPDTLIITAEYDPLRDEGEAYGVALQKAGATVKVARLENAIHGFLALPPRFAHVKRAYALIQEFLTEG